MICCFRYCCRYHRYYLPTDTIATSIDPIYAIPKQVVTSLGCLLYIRCLPPYLHILPLPTALTRLALVILTLPFIYPIKLNGFSVWNARSFKLRCC